VYSIELYGNSAVPIGGELQSLVITMSSCSAQRVPYSTGNG